MKSKKQFNIAYPQKTINPILLSQSLFDDGSIGKSCFPQELEGRKRVLNLDQPLVVYRKQNRLCTRFFTDKEIKILARVGINSLKELLNSNIIELRQKGVEKEILSGIVSKVILYFEDILIGPEGYLLAAIYSKEPVLFPPYLVPLNSENTRRIGIDKALGTALAQMSKKIIEYRFGLYDGNPKTMQEIGEIISRTKNRLEIIIDDCLRRLNYPGVISKYLLQFKPHQNSK